MSLFSGVVGRAADVVALVTSPGVEAVLVGPSATRIADAALIDILTGSASMAKIQITFMKQIKMDNPLVQ